MKKKIIYYALALSIIFIAILYKFNLLSGELKYFIVSFAVTCALAALTTAIFDYIKKSKNKITGGNKMRVSAGYSTSVY